MALFGLTWLSAAFTFSVGGSNAVRYIFQSLFVVCGTFQGVFFFFFFCVLDKKARYAWRYAICKKRPKIDSSQFSSSTNRTILSRKTSLVTMQTPMDYTKAPYLPELKEKLSEEETLGELDKTAQYEESPKVISQEESPDEQCNGKTANHETSPEQEELCQHEQCSNGVETVSQSEECSTLSETLQHGESRDHEEVREATTEDDEESQIS